MEPSSNKSSIAIPLAIVFGFGLIAIAIYFSGIGNSSREVAAPTTTANVPTVKSDIKPVGEDDYIKGNPNAPILIVEYSDYDCPYCKNFHETMNRIMNEYGVSGKIAWVYRQLPIPQLHPNAPAISEAALCVGEVAGNDAFWKFSDSVFSGRLINEGTNITKLPEYAVAAGASKEEYNACMSSGRMKSVVTDSMTEAAQAGIQGTPHSFVLIGNQQAPIEGAQPYEVVKQIVENLLGQLEGTTPSAN